MNVWLTLTYLLFTAWLVMDFRSRKKLAEISTRRAADLARHKALLSEVLPIVQFAVANLPPETTKGWPADGLHSLADHLAIQGDRLELATAFHEFAVEASKFEAHRKANPQVVVPATQGDYGPQDDEAKAVHALYSGRAVPVVKTEESV